MRPQMMTVIHRARDTRPLNLAVWAPELPARADSTTKHREVEQPHVDARKNHAEHLQLKGRVVHAGPARSSGRTIRFLR